MAQTQKHDIQAGASPNQLLRWQHSSSTKRPFSDHRQAALALLNGGFRLSRKAGQFLGQLAVDSAPLSEAQAGWLGKLLDRANLPPLAAL